MASLSTGTATYHPDIFQARQTDGWDDYHYRLARYEILDGFYHNMQYHRIKSYAQSLKVQEQLYKHVRGVYNPAKRLVDSYVSKVYGGMLDVNNGTGGAIPLGTDDPRLIETITTLWRASMWGQKKSLYVRYGAKLGDSFIKIVDDIGKGQVRLEVVDPMKIKEITKDADGTITRVEFEYYIRRDNKLVKYNEIITPERFQAQDENGDAIWTNGRNERITEWDNEYGFVPLVHVQHTDEGLLYGAPAMHGIYHKINELNDIASILNDGMRRQVEMPAVSINAKVATLDAGSDQSTSSESTIDKPRKDTMNVLNLVGENVDFKTLPPVLNIGDSITNITEIQKEIERDSPELALHRMREGSNLTAPGVRSAYDDAIAKFQEARGNYDTGLEQAHQIAIAIGGMRGYDGFRGYGLMSLEDGSLDHQIQERPVINDTLGLNDKLAMTIQGVQTSMPRAFFLEIGWGDREADEYAAAGQAARDSFLMSSPFDVATSTPPVEDSDATPDDAFDTRQNSGMNEADVLNADELLREVV